MHLTNYSINKFPDSQTGDSTADKLAAGDADAAEEFEDSTGVGSERSPPVWQCKRRLHNFLHPRVSNVGGERWKLNERVFWRRVDDLVRSTLFTIVPYLRVSYWAECQRIPKKPGKVPPHSFQVSHFFG